MSPMRFRLAALLSGLALGCMPAPALAVERLVLQMPFLETSITLNLEKSESAVELIRTSPDLVDLQGASGGKLLRLLEQIFLAPLPLHTQAFLEGATGQPLLEQALLAAASVVKLEGVEIDSSGSMLSNALKRAEQKGQSNILGFLREMPGQEATVDLSMLLQFANRLVINLEQGVVLAKTGQSAEVTPALQGPLKHDWRRSELNVSVPHRQNPLRVLLLQPTGLGNGRLLVISHGLWDDPESFEGWGEMLSSAGYTVLMPDHPGSDFSQQQSMLSGDRPPPGPEELRERPKDISALLDLIETGKINVGQDLNTQSVAVIGHSWGATTSLQLAGAHPTDRKLLARCKNQKDPERNISWVLQCSWLSGIDQAGLADSRVKAVVAVSPPLRLLFDPASATTLSAKVLLVSGTRDWVVPSGPEAITPMRNAVAAQKGHRLVLAEGADHFTLRSFKGEDQTALIGPLLLAWVNEQLGTEDSFRFSSGGWGHSKIRLIDVSERL